METIRGTGFREPFPHLIFNNFYNEEELNLIWKPESQKSLTHWNQIREEWPNEEIRLYGPGTASGTYDYFAEVICGKKVGTRGDYTCLLYTSPSPRD